MQVVPSATFEKFVIFVLKNRLSFLLCNNTITNQQQNELITDVGVLLLGSLVPGQRLANRETPLVMQEVTINKCGMSL